MKRFSQSYHASGSTIKSWWHLFTSHRHSWQFENTGVCDPYASGHVWLLLLGVLRLSEGLTHQFKSICLMAFGCFSGAQPCFCDKGFSGFLIKRLCADPWVGSWDFGKRSSLVSPDSTLAAACHLRPPWKESWRQRSVSTGEKHQCCSLAYLYPLGKVPGKEKQTNKEKQDKTEDPRSRLDYLSIWSYYPIAATFPGPHGSNSRLGMP